MRLGVVMACASASWAIAVSSAVARADQAPVSPKPGPAVQAAEPPLPPLDEARPPPPPEAPSPSVPWHEHIEVGGGVAFTQMSAASGQAFQPVPVRFLPGVGFHVDLSWQVFRYLRFTGYMLEHNNPLEVPAGSLVPGATFSAPSVHVYSFGARISPTLPIGDRVRLWLTAGAGWGYLGYGRFTQIDVPPGPGVVNPMPVIRERSSTIFEIPVGVGYAFEIVPRWLSLHFEVTATFAPSQVGDALGQGQYVDAKGAAQTVNPMPQIDVAFAETLGLSIHL